MSEGSLEREIVYVQEGIKPREGERILGERAKRIGQVGVRETLDRGREGKELEEERERRLGGNQTERNLREGRRGKEGPNGRIDRTKIDQSCAGTAMVLFKKRPERGEEVKKVKVRANATSDPSLPSFPPGQPPPFTLPFYIHTYTHTETQVYTHTCRRTRRRSVSGLSFPPVRSTFALGL